jgi:hypothetical protein
MKLGLQPKKSGLDDDEEALKGVVAQRYRKLREPDDSDKEVFDLYFAVGSLLSQGKGRQAGQLLDRLEQRLAAVEAAKLEAMTRTADQLTDLYEALQKRFGAVFDEARRRKLPTDALIKAELEIEKDLKKTSADIAANKDALAKKISGYERIGRDLAALMQRQRDQERADAANTVVADQLTDRFEALQKKFGAVFTEAKRLNLATAALVKAEVGVEGKLRKTSAEIIADAKAVDKSIADYDAAGQALAAAIVDHRKQEAEKLRLAAEKQRQQDERDRQWLEGTSKKKPAATSAKPEPAKADSKPKYVKLDLGAPMTFKEKFKAGMVRQVGGVQKEITSFDKAGAFSTFYFFAQGESDEPAYEIHIHRKPDGTFSFGQVKPSRLAKVARGGEEEIKKGEMATYGIPPLEPYP